MGCMGSEDKSLREAGDSVLFILAPTTMPRTPWLGEMLTWGLLVP